MQKARIVKLDSDSRSKDCFKHSTLRYYTFTKHWIKDNKQFTIFIFSYVSTRTFTYACRIKNIHMYITSFIFEISNRRFFTLHTRYSILNDKKCVFFSISYFSSLFIFSSLILTHPVSEIGKEMFSCFVVLLT